MISSIQELYEIYFPILAELKSHKDASVEDIMNLLLLEGPLADAPGMGDLQPDIEQLKFLIHRANIAAERSALLDVWTPLSKPLSIQMLIGEASTSAGVPAATGNVQGDAATVEFEKEDPDTTSECDLLS
nr:hypothetical protein [Tanacetum cinerariifolium]